MKINNEGPKKLYQELLLEIKTDYGEVLYNKKLADFTGLQERKVEISQEKELEFTIRFREHLGNDFQGLNTNFSITFIATDDEGVNEIDADLVSLDGVIDSGDGGFTLPSTATNIFTFLLIGGILVIIGGTLVMMNKRLKKA